MNKVIFIKIIIIVIIIIIIIGKKYLHNLEKYLKQELSTI